MSLTIPKNSNWAKNHGALVVQIYGHLANQNVMI